MSNIMRILQTAIKLAESNDELPFQRSELMQLDGQTGGAENTPR